MPVHTILDNIKNDVLWQLRQETESESGKSSDELKNTGSDWAAQKTKGESLATLGEAKQRETKGAQALENEQS